MKGGTKPPTFTNIKILLKDVFFMTKTKKMTKREMYTKILSFAEIQADPELVKGIQHEIELLDRKNSSDRKLSKNAEENVHLKAEILKIMSKEPDRLFTATEIWKQMENWDDLSNQRISALLKQLKEEGKIKKIEEKKKSLFQYVG